MQVFYQYFSHERKAHTEQAVRTRWRNPQAARYFIPQQMYAHLKIPFFKKKHLTKNKIDRVEASLKILKYR